MSNKNISGFLAETTMLMVGEAQGEVSLDVEQEFGIVYIKFDAKHSNEDTEQSYGYKHFELR